MFLKLLTQNELFRQMVADGNKLIFGTSFGYMNYMQKLAKEYPDVKFEHATGYKTAPNMTNYNIRFYEAAICRYACRRCN